MIKSQLNITNYYNIGDISSTLFTFGTGTARETVNFSDMSFPITVDQIRTFERNNPKFSFNVYEVSQDGKKVMGPARQCKQMKDIHINLLTILNNNNYHYCLIHNMTRLVKNQFTKSKTEGGEFCELCQNYYYIGSVRHKKECSRIKTTYPEQGSTLTFEHYERMISPPVVVYADMESVLSPVENTTRGERTTVIQKHEACAVSYYIKHSHKDSLDEYHSFQGKY